MLHDHTKFGYKMLYGSEDIIWTFTNILNLCCDLDLDLECSNPVLFFLQDTPASDGVLSNQVWLQTDQHFGRDSKNSHILII